MSSFHKAEIACPRCKASQSVEIWDSVNVTLDPELKKAFFGFSKGKPGDPVISCAEPGGIFLSGGDGLSMKNAIVIHAKSEFLGIGAEYAYLHKKHGERDTDWELEHQRLLRKGILQPPLLFRTRYYDEISIKTKDGERIIYYFDISHFYRKF